MIKKDLLSRRRFLKGSAAIVTGLATPALLPSGVLGVSGRAGPNDRVIVGFVGTGKRAQHALMRFMPRDAKIVAVCDCYTPRMAEAVKELGGRWSTYQHYEKMFEKEKLDGVVIPTRTHQRALTCIHACQAGLDVYAEKPMAMTIREGRVIAAAVKKHRRVYQLGTQQRSIPINRHACELIRSGGLGKIKEVSSRNYRGPRPLPQSLPGQSVPQGLDWDRWTNQMKLRPYNSEIHLKWTNNWYDYGIGDISNLGAHGLDMIQFALGMDETGPVELWPLSDRYGDDSVKRVAECPVAIRYASGVVVKLELNPEKSSWQGGIFKGEKGQIEVRMNVILTPDSDLTKAAPKPIDVSAKEGPVAFLAQVHLQNWIDCIKTRKPPNAHEEIGQRSNTVTQLVYMTRALNRRLHWSPEKERFPGDEEANALLDRTRRKGYELPAVL